LARPYEGTETRRVGISYIQYNEGSTTGFVTGEDLKYSEKTMASVTSPTTNPIWNFVFLNSNKGGEKPVTNRLTNGKEYVPYFFHRLNAAYGKSRWSDGDDPNP